MEIGFFDRGPVSADELYLAGNWAAYWHNGRIYAPEIVRGIDIFRLLPSSLLSVNEVAAAELIRFDEFNTQTQRRFVWPDEPVVALAYLDQLVRAESVDAEMASQIRIAVGTNTADAELIATLNTAAQSASDDDANRFQAIAGWLQRSE